MVQEDDMMFVENTTGVQRVEVEIDVYPLCTLGEDKPFKCSGTLSYTPGPRLVELVRLTERCRKELSGKRMIAEQVPDEILELIRGGHLRDVVVRVLCESPNHPPVMAERREEQWP